MRKIVKNVYDLNVDTNFNRMVTTIACQQRIMNKSQPDVADAAMNEIFDFNLI